MGDSELKEVRFDLYCATCKHKDIDTEHVDVTKTTEPCNSCLETGMREGTEKPEHWEAALETR